MSFATVHSCTLSGIKALPVTVEVHTSGGLPGMSIVGLPQSAVKESKDRVRAAIENVGLKYPQSRIIVNLAPADLPKHGGRYDFPIALGLLLASGQLPANCLSGLLVLGELGLDGELRSVTGVLPTAFAFANSPRALYIPLANAAEALRSVNTKIYAVAHLEDAVVQLKQRSRTPLHLLRAIDLDVLDILDSGASTTKEPRVDMAEVLGQYKARRALEIAAAGSHNLLMVGPPGTGKSMLASRLSTIQPEMSEVESMEAASVASISRHGFTSENWGVRPFRAPHHTASGVALVGGGSIPMPGEISLAHAGVLFLDELPEFTRTVLDVLREPLETGTITVSRAARQAIFPSRFQLIAAMNPCPCGYYEDPEIDCRCGMEQIVRYQSRISGPFLDRIDLHLVLQREVIKGGVLNSAAAGESSQRIRKRVMQARDKQLQRQKCSNAMLDAKGLRKYIELSASARDLFAKANQSMTLSLRAQHRLLRVARTIADIEGSPCVESEHLAECLCYRRTMAVDRLASR